MRKNRKNLRGFTIIEVTIFLAVTGLLFLMVTMGVQSSIYHQRYTDAVQSFADFLRNLYSEVTNVQGLSNAGGRSEFAIYGKMVVFDDSDEQVVRAYTVVGKAKGDGSSVGSTLSLLQGLEADVSVDSKLAGITEEYIPKWGSRIQQKDGFNNYTGTILIVRNPGTGTVGTFVSNQK